MSSIDSIIAKHYDAMKARQGDEGNAEPAAGGEGVGTDLFFFACSWAALWFFSFS